jgi:hypothetical protein
MAHVYTYDELNRVRTAVTAKGGTVVYHARYLAYDQVGNRLEIDETSLQADNSTVSTRHLVYGYDRQYRLRSERWAGHEYVYHYDANGNRTRMEHDGQGDALLLAFHVEPHVSIVPRPRPLQGQTARTRSATASSGRGASSRRHTSRRPKTVVGTTANARALRA